LTSTVSRLAAWRQLRNFVNGEFVPAQAGLTSDIVDPSSGEPYARAPVSGSAGFEDYTRIKHVMSYLG